MISEFKLIQQNELYDQDAYYEVVFTPENTIGPSGMILMEYSEEVEVVEGEDFACYVQTYQAYN